MVAMLAHLLLQNLFVNLFLYGGTYKIYVAGFQNLSHSGKKTVKKKLHNKEHRNLYSPNTSIASEGM
jgi:hypothetical protein